MTLAMLATLILIAWYAGSFGNTCVNNGKDYSVGLYYFVFSTMLCIICLYFTGFFGPWFNVWHWPQFVWLILSSIGVGVFFNTPGLVMKGNHNILSSAIAYSIIWFLYYKGGVLNCFFNQ